MKFTRLYGVFKSDDGIKVAVMNSVLPVNIEVN